MLSRGKPSILSGILEWLGPHSELMKNRVQEGRSQSSCSPQPWHYLSRPLILRADGHLPTSITAFPLSPPKAQMMKEQWAFLNVMASWSAEHFFLWMYGIASCKDNKYLIIEGQPHTVTVKRGIRQPRCTFKSLSQIILLPVHSHPTAPITAGIKSKLLSLAYKAFGSSPCLPSSFISHHSPSYLELSKLPFFLLLIPIFGTLTLLLPLPGSLSQDCCWISLSRFWLKCHILRGPLWTSNLGELLGPYLSYYLV